MRMIPEFLVTMNAPSGDDGEFAGAHTMRSDLDVLDWRATNADRRREQSHGLLKDLTREGQVIDVLDSYVALADNDLDLLAQPLL